MADTQGIVVSVQDQVPTSISAKLRDIGTAAQAGKSAIDDLQRALNSLNSGALRTLQAQFNALNLNGVSSGAQASSNAFQSLNTSLGALAAGINNTNSALGTANGLLSQMTGQLNAIHAALGNVGQSNQSAIMTFDLWAIGAHYVKEYAKELYEATRAIVEWRAEADRATIGINQVSGSVAGAAATNEYLTNTIDKLGLNMKAATDGYIKFAASTKDTALQGEKTMQIFTAISEAATVLHLSQDQVNNTFLALSQMASKGVVSMEELRRQLADHIPGAMNLAAQAMGVTTAQLNQMVSSGQVLAEDFLPKFAAAVHKNYAGALDEATQSAQASLNRFDNAWTRLERTVGESKLGDLAVGIMNRIADAVSDTNKAIVNFGKMSWSDILKNGVLNGPSNPALPTNPSAANMNPAALAARTAAEQAARIQDYLNGTGHGPTAAHFLTPAETLRKNQTELKKEFDAATQGLKKDSQQYLDAYSAYQNRLDALNEKANRPAVRAAHRQQQNQLSADIVAARQASEQIKAEYDSQTENLRTNLANQVITQQQYIVQMGDARQKELAALRDVAQKQADLASGKDQLSERQKFLVEVKKLNGEMVTDAAKTQTQLAALAAKTRLGAEQALSNFQLGGQQRDSQNADSLDMAGQGQKAIADLTALQAIMKQAAQTRQQLTNQARRDGTLYSQEYVNGIAAINQAEQQQLANEKIYFQQRDQLNSDWSTGVMAALSNISELSTQTSQTTQQLFTNMFSGMIDQIAQFATTGKLSFNSLIESMVQGVIRLNLQIIASQAASALLGYLAPSSFSPAFSAGGSAFSLGTSTATVGGSPLMGLGGGMGFAAGGYTGNSGRSTPVGVVHGQEFVVNARATAMPGVRPLLEALNRGRPGYANGGFVGNGPSGVAIGTPNIVINNYAGSQVEASAHVSQDSSGNNQIEIMIRQVENQLAGNIAKGRGALHDSIRNKFNVNSRPGK
jgi:lambda family phage tail tape measure protein